MSFQHVIALGLFVGLALGLPQPLYAEQKPYTEEKKSDRSTWIPFLGPKQPNATKQLAFAKQLEKEKKYKKAAQQYQQLTRFWPSSEEAAEAQLMYATVQHQRGKYDKAFYAYQKLIDEYESKFEYATILERQFQIAKSVMTEKHGTFIILPGYERPRDAIPYLETIIDNGPRWEHAPEVQYLIGEIREREEDLELAIADYMNTMLSYPNSKYAEQAALGRCRCLMELSERSPNDIDAAQEAWYALTLFKVTYPDSVHKEKVEKYLKKSYTALAKRSYNIALFYDKNTSKPKAALIAYQTFVKGFPSSEWTPHAKQRIQALIQMVGPTVE